ncbi:hypothetical protein [Microcoleus sp. FACHB-68]|uniref:hypothetical protein n=1 Tax=Microcoleus sp. FACHB-68 TaxID=2692826 RepID=UPI001682CF41|nr:hypothetical protein [Microcoleus sp. FACHB-68]MBD1937337.1 hypothetical protein [Microcoleus sp. FACHB-68]
MIRFCGHSSIGLKQFNLKYKTENSLFPTSHIAEGIARNQATPLNRLPHTGTLPNLRTAEVRSHKSCPTSATLDTVGSRTEPNSRRLKVHPHYRLSTVPFQMSHAQRP